jgi:hypothetical protein
VTASLTTAVACSSSSWTSATTVTCAVVSYSGGASGSVVIVGLQVGTSLGAFSFDGMSIVLGLVPRARPQFFQLTSQSLKAFSLVMCSPCGLPLNTFQLSCCCDRDNADRLRAQLRLEPVYADRYGRRHCMCHVGLELSNIPALLGPIGLRQQAPSRCHQFSRWYGHALHLRPSDCCSVPVPHPPSHALANHTDSLDKLRSNGLGALVGVHAEL